MFQALAKREEGAQTVEAGDENLSGVLTCRKGKGGE